MIDDAAVIVADLLPETRNILPQVRRFMAKFVTKIGDIPCQTVNPCD